MALMEYNLCKYSENDLQLRFYYMIVMLGGADYDI